MQLISPIRNQIFTKKIALVAPLIVMVFLYHVNL